VGGIGQSGDFLYQVLIAYQRFYSLYQPSNYSYPTYSVLSTYLLLSMGGLNLVPISYWVTYLLPYRGHLAGLLLLVKCNLLPWCSLLIALALT